MVKMRALNQIVRSFKNGNLSRGDEFQVSREKADFLLRQGAAVEVGEGEAEADQSSESSDDDDETADGRLEGIEKAVHQLDPEQDFTAEGVPKVGALSQAFGDKVTTGERDQAFRAAQDNGFTLDSDDD